MQHAFRLGEVRKISPKMSKKAMTPKSGFALKIANGKDVTDWIAVDFNELQRVIRVLLQWRTCAECDGRLGMIDHEEQDIRAGEPTTNYYRYFGCLDCGLEASR